MAYPLLNFARLLLDFPFGFQIGITRNLSDLLLDCSLHFVEAALDLVFRAGFHIFSPWPSYNADCGFSEPLSGLSLLSSRGFHEHWVRTPSIPFRSIHRLINTVFCLPSTC